MAPSEVNDLRHSYTVSAFRLETHAIGLHRPCNSKKNDAASRLVYAIRLLTG